MVENVSPNKVPQNIQTAYANDTKNIQTGIDKQPLNMAQTTVKSILQRDFAIYTTGYTVQGDKVKAKGTYTGDVGPISKLNKEGLKKLMEYRGQMIAKYGIGTKEYNEAITAEAVRLAGLPEYSTGTQTAAAISGGTPAGDTATVSETAKWQGKVNDYLNATVGAKIFDLPADQQPAARQNLMAAMDLASKCTDPKKLEKYYNWLQSPEGQSASFETIKNKAAEMLK